MCPSLYDDVSHRYFHRKCTTAGNFRPKQNNVSERRHFTKISTDTPTHTMFSLRNSDVLSHIADYRHNSSLFLPPISLRNRASNNSKLSGVCAVIFRFLQISKLLCLFVGLVGGEGVEGSRSRLCGVPRVYHPICIPALLFRESIIL